MFPIKVSATKYIYITLTQIQSCKLNYGYLVRYLKYDKTVYLLRLCTEKQFIHTRSTTVRESLTSLSISILTDFNSLSSTSFNLICSSWAALTAY